MKILFVASRSWDDELAVSTILDEAVGSAPVEIVCGYETRGPEAYIAEWVRKRARLRRTSLDRVKAGKQFTSGPTSLDKIGTTLPERKARRDEYMVTVGGYDLAISLYRTYRRGPGGSKRPLEIANRAVDLGIKTLLYDYDNTPRTEGTAL